MVKLSVVHKRPFESVAVLNYMAVVPFFRPYVRPSALAEQLDDKAFSDLDKEGRVKHINALLRGLFTDVAKLFTRELVLSRDEIADDCNVGISALIYETHVVLFLRLPAVVAPHVAMIQIRRSLVKLADATEIRPCMRTYGALLSTTYLILSSVPGACAGNPLGDYSAFKKLLKTFCRENDINNRFLLTMELDQEEQWGRKVKALNDHFSVLK